MRVLIVDDSVVFRTQITSALTGIPEIEIAGTAANGSIALQRLSQMSVDVMTLDLEMPDMDGLEVLKKLKEQKHLVKVIVFSSQTTKGAEKALAALSLGADDVVAKPNIAETGHATPVDAIRETLVPKIMQFKSASIIPMNLANESSSTTIATAATTSNRVLKKTKPSLIVIASSTGGPAALEYIFSNTKVNFNIPILIAQHMPPIFTEILARRISDLTGLRCVEAKNDDLIQAGSIYIAPGDFHMEIAGTEKNPKIHLTKNPHRNAVRPAADYLFETAAKIFGEKVSGIVLTGMGEDGLQGAKAIKQVGGNILIQNKESCVVFGMPGAVFNENIFDDIGDLNHIASYLTKYGV